MPYMYILECADGSYYTGSTWDLERRLWQHQNGMGAKHTANRLPVKLVYCEYYDRIDDAFRREKQVQGWSRRKKQALIEGNVEKLVEYSRNYTQYPAGAVAATSAGSAATSTGTAAASAGTAAASTGSAAASAGTSATSAGSAATSAGTSAASAGTAAASAGSAADEPMLSPETKPGPVEGPFEGDDSNSREAGYGG